MKKKTMTKREENNFEQWLLTFLDKKGISLGDFLESDDGTLLQVGHVVTAILATNHEYKKTIKKVLIDIDINNGNVMYFIEYLAKDLNA